MLLGDFNETYMGSWVATWAALYGGWQPDFQHSTTRWAGSRVIDYVVANFDLPEMEVRSEKLSDHLIVTCKFDYDYKVDAPQWRFQPGIIFAKPAWISKQRWQILFDDVYNKGQDDNWTVCCKMVENCKNWDEMEYDDGQLAADYEWCLTCAQLSWSFVGAARLALLEIPGFYEDQCEMRRVLHMANFRRFKGFEVKLQERTMPKTPMKIAQYSRKRLVRLGRLAELQRRLAKDNKDEETANLVRKLYGLESCDEISLSEVVADLEQLQETHDNEEEDRKYLAIKKWKADMCTNITAKTAWLNKKGSKLSPAIEAEDKVTATKMQAAEVLYGYWDQLWRNQRWNDVEKPQKIQRLVEKLKPDIEGLRIPNGRPSLEIFQKQLGHIKGCAGADGWTAAELQVIAASHAASAAVWSTMERWETFQKIPKSVANCKLVHVPKKEKRILLPGQFRPIAIMSSFWRSWSSSWMRSKWIQTWTQQLFPTNITGGMVGAQGPELMATVIAHELNIKRHGLTMDFRHAFDTVDVEVMEEVFLQILPQSCRRWFSLLFGQWKAMDRWVVIDSGVFPKSLKVKQGLPQGDPGSCVVMATLMLALKKMVDSEVVENDSVVFQSIYMDDRTAVATSLEKLQEVQAKWHQLADEFHLIENPEKAQFVQMGKQGSAFEVLGTVIGNFQEKKHGDTRLMKRMQSIEGLHKKLGILPGGIHMKMKDVGVFVRSKMAYGWISTQPKMDWVHKQEQVMWKSWAKLTYANAHMRRIIAGAHTSLRMVAFLRQLRLLAQRNCKLREMDVELVQCQLDKLVYSMLEKLNWRFEDGKFIHELYAEGFCIDDLVDDNTWWKVGHYVRESYRMQHYEFFLHSGRHELAGGDLPPYDPKRRAMACKWAGKDGLAWMLIQGAVQSPRVRMRSSGIRSRCHVCGEVNPAWDHLWPCFTGAEVPQDALLRRQLWPRDAGDLSLCTKFLEEWRRFSEQ